MMPDEPEPQAPPEPKTCANCQLAPAGPGGILCPPCKDAIAALTVADWYPDVAS
jgi:hypothetical protein